MSGSGIYSGIFGEGKEKDRETLSALYRLCAAVLAEDIKRDFNLEESVKGIINASVGINHFRNIPHQYVDKVHGFWEAICNLTHCNPHKMRDLVKNWESEELEKKILVAIGGTRSAVKRWFEKNVTKDEDRYSKEYKEKAPIIYQKINEEKLVKYIRGYIATNLEAEEKEVTESARSLLSSNNSPSPSISKKKEKVRSKSFY